MNVKKYSYAALFVMALAGSGCSDWLDVKPEIEVEATDLFSQEKGFKDALTACYVKMDSTSLYGRDLTMTAIEYLAQHWDFSSGNDRDAKLFKTYDYEADVVKTTIEEVYGCLYNTIVQANSVLENIHARGHVIASEKMRNLIEAEALSIRAFCHTDVLRLFGQMPQNATIKVQLPYAKEVSTAMVPYYPYEQFVGLILQDIEDAQKLFETCDPVMDYTFDELDNFSADGSEVELEDTFMGYRRFRFNYWAMEALKARLYLYTNDKTNARIAANNVIAAQTTKGKSILALGGKDDFKNKYYACPSECIMALSNSKLDKIVNGLFSYYTNNLSTKHYEELFKGQNLDAHNRYKNVWNKDAQNNQGLKYVHFRKYEQPAEAGGDLNTLMLRRQVIPLLRLSEMYLIAIETATSLSEANALYKTYMAAREVIAPELTAAQLQEEVVNEYRREFFGEGQMFYTYKRLGAKEMLWRVDEVVEKNYIVPLPSTELGFN